MLTNNVLKIIFSLISNLDSIFKSRDITLPTKVRLVKAMVLNMLSRLDINEKIIFNTLFVSI